MTHVTDYDKLCILTPREKEVAGLLTEGLTNPQIKGRLGIARETVKSHVGSILSKLGVASRRDVEEALEVQKDGN
jgi:DNA-binding CsgD family transcriptional regulator